MVGESAVHTGCNRLVPHVKQNPSDLAILGGAPAFAEPLHVGRPNIGDRSRFLQHLTQILDRRWLTNDGPALREFEQRIAGLLGVRHCVAVTNGTVALELTIRALALRGEVIVPAFTFVATAHALQWHGITPVFCDIDPVTHTIDPEAVEAAIGPNTTGIIGVHVWGHPCDIVALTAIARRHRLHLLFDAAHAFGCSYRGELLGRFGDAEILSFHATKFFHTLEGGAVVTNNDDLARQLRLMRNFGFAGYDRVVSIGINAKMTEVAAAMGLTNLDSLDTFVAVNRRHYDQYRQTLAGLPGITPVEYDTRERSNYQYVVIQVDEARAGLSRDELMEVLRAENVLVRRYFYPGVHRMEPYRSRLTTLPKTDHLCAQVLSLPTGTAVQAADVETICGIIRLAVTHAGDVRAVAAEAVRRHDHAR